MRIKLLLPISVVIFSIAFTIQNFGMKEINTENDTEEKLDSSTQENHNQDNNNIETKEIGNPPITDSNFTNNDKLNINNINNIKNDNHPIDDSDFTHIAQPLNNNAGNRAFLTLYKRIECIYESSFGLPLLEAGTSFGMSILNNIFGFEKMVKNKFYVNRLLLKSGFKLGIPIVSFIIIDFNVCIYNWLVACMKYLVIHYNKAPLKQFKINCETTCIKNKLKLIYFFNVFNIDIKLNLFGWSLCLPLTKILEIWLIGKALEEVNHKKNCASSLADLNAIDNQIYQDIRRTARESASDVGKTLKQIRASRDRTLEDLNKIKYDAGKVIVSIFNKKQ